MITTNTQEVIKQFLQLSMGEREKFIEYVTEQTLLVDQKAIVEAKFADGYVCPHCGAKGKGVTRCGRSATGKQRYKCKHCHCTFSATTGGVMYNSKLSPKKWREFVSCFLHGMTVRETAELIGVNRNTAFLWRHKICDSLNLILENITLSGIVEADETYFRLSYKGGKAEGRKPRKRGSSIFHKGRKRGLSFEQVCVPCAVNRSGQSVAKVSETGKGSYAGIEAVLGGHIAEASTVCADGASVYNRLASEHGLNRVMVDAYSSKKGCYSIQHINAYHGGLKRFVREFNGVSTKHLNNYLLWFNFATYAKETYTEKMRLLVRHIMTAQSYTRRVDVPNRPAIPYICQAVNKVA